MNNITKVLKRLGLKKKDYDLFGETKAKIKLDFKICSEFILCPKKS